MIARETVVKHLIQNDCFLVDQNIHRSPNGEVYRNSVSGRSCYIRKIPNFDGITFVKICQDLLIKVPDYLEDLEHVLDLEKSIPKRKDDQQ